MYDDSIEGHITDLVYREYETAARNQSSDNADFEAVIDLLENKRNEKEYDWMSNVSVPEYAAMVLTESSQWASQDFGSREFVDIYLEGDGEYDGEKCLAAKRLINKTLNRRKLYYYHKYIRARTINSTAGVVYAACMWEQKLRQEHLGYEDIDTGAFDEYGAPVIERKPVYRPVPLIDHFNFEVLDPRNVFTDNTYCYSVQEKPWITLRSEKTYEGLKEDEKSHGYFNLKKIKELKENGYLAETETSKESYNKETQAQKVTHPVTKPFDVLERYGKIWAIVITRDEDGNPVKIKPGFAQDGSIQDNAELIEAITTVVYHGSTKVLIRFQATPFIDAAGDPYKPIIRGICYIHPTKDVGMSDGKYARELQIGVNDTINMSNDRVKLATMPVFKGKKYVTEDNDQIYIEPEHVIPLEDPTNDLQELQIRDNIQGALAQTSLFINGMQKVMAVYTTTMGNTPDMASTTATAVAGADARTNMRANYKALTFEYSFLCDLYWMILQMSYRFMHPDTAVKLLGMDAVEIFDPNADYVYQPVSSNIEVEYSKTRKMGIIDQVLGRLANIPNPKTPVLINKLMVKFFDLLGADYQDFKDALLDEGPAGQQAAMRQGNTGTPEGGGGMPLGMTSNQNGVPVSGQEAMTRMQ
jgi:hypothetical protein